MQHRPRCESLLSWLSWARAAVVSSLLLLLGWEMHRTVSLRPMSPPWIATHKDVAQFALDVGVVDEVVSVVQDTPPRADAWVRSLGRPMPSKPLPGQQKPPCERGEKEINGGCWFKEADERPPCGDTLFDYEGRCYFASPSRSRIPASDQP